MTEKDYNPEQRNAKAIKQQDKIAKVKAETPKKVSENKSEKKETSETKPVQKRAPEKKEVVVNAKSVPVSTKYAINICRFIKNKEIDKAIEDLEKVISMKKAVPMRGEHAHKKSVKGLASGAGRYPINASKYFIVVLKSLRGNAINHNLELPKISEAMANKASEPFGRFGRWARKRTHITIKAISKKTKNNKKIIGKKK